MRGVLGRLAPLLLVAATVCACAPGSAADPGPAPDATSSPSPETGGRATTPRAGSESGHGEPRTEGVPDPANAGQTAMDEAGFWRIVDDTRTRAGGNSEKATQLLTKHLRTLDDATLTAFQERYLEAAARLFTWRHVQAAEMACGFVSEDVFTDWRAFLIAHGRSTFDAVADDADAVADVTDLPAGCEGAGELFGAAASIVHDDRHAGDEAALDAFPVETLDEPTGPRLRQDDAVRADLPRLSARIPHDGLGKGPGTYVDSRSGVLTRLVGTLTGTVMQRLSGAG